jgi:hypothetical protein
VDAEAFVQELADMGEPELRALARLVRHDALSAEGELAWWRATTEVGAVLRSTRCGRRAAVVAHEAARAVVVAGDRCGLGTERELITAVARAAADAARAMVADPEGAGVSQVLVAPFRAVVCEPMTV